MNRIAEGKVIQIKICSGRNQKEQKAWQDTDYVNMSWDKVEEARRNLRREGSSFHSPLLPESRPRVLRFRIAANQSRLPEQAQPLVAALT